MTDKPHDGKTRTITAQDDDLTDEVMDEVLDAYAEATEAEQAEPDDDTPGQGPARPR